MLSTGQTYLNYDHAVIISWRGSLLIRALLFCECTLATSDHSSPLHALQFAALLLLYGTAFSAKLSAALLPFAQATTLLMLHMVFPHGDTGWHLQMPQVQGITPSPDLTSAQQQELEELSALQHEMQAEQQQQQPGANQSSANCQAADAALEGVEAVTA